MVDHEIKKDQPQVKIYYYFIKLFTAEVKYKNYSVKI